MFDDSQYALLAIGGPSIALAVGVLLCILNRQRKKRTLRFDPEVDQLDTIVEPSPTADQPDEASPEGDNVTADVGKENQKGIRKRKLYKPVEEEVSGSSVIDGRENEYQLLDTGEPEVRRAEEPGSETIDDSEPKASNIAEVRADEADSVPATSEKTGDLMHAEPTLIAPIASPKDSPSLEKHTTAEEFWKQCKNDTLCKYCNTTFTVWTRRHHCRNCCASVCAGCSPNVIALPGWDGQQRVCNQCWQQLSITTQAPSAEGSADDDTKTDAAPAEDAVTIKPEQDENAAVPEEEQPNPMMGQSAFVIIGQE